MDLLKKYLAEQQGLGDDLVDMVASFHQVRQVKKNEFFIKEGDVNRHTAFLLDGIVRYFAYDRSVNDPTCFFSYPCHLIIDPYTYFERKPAGLNAQAVCNCKLAVMSYDRYTRLLNEFPEARNLFDRMIMQISLEFANQKALLSLSANERYEYFLRHYPQVARQAPLQYIASYLGITQPSLSRIRKGETLKEK
ncbi:MAG: Crp/Fnr family transcriptional regulator [Bacteroidota bacterium]